MNVSDDQIIVVLDVETTGLSAAYGDRICEVGLVRAQGDEILDTYQTLVNPGRPISPGASRVNGITDADVQSAPSFARIADQVLAWIDAAALVCHNAPFDLSFLEAEFSRLGQPWQPAAVIDTLQIARRYFDFYSNSLASVAASLGIETPQAHRALGDALTTFHVFRHLRGRLTGQGRDLASSNLSRRAQVEVVVLPPEIREALEANTEITISYLDAKGAESTRKITPLRVQIASGVVYLIAYCHLRRAERNFRLDRIVKLGL